MSAPAKLIVIGLDSGDRDLIAQWSAEGHLPTFAMLLKDATTGQVGNPHGMEAGSVWPTFHTGVQPAKHGQYDGVRVFDPDLYDHRTMRPDEMSPLYFWRHLKKHGLKACLIDALYMRMPPEGEFDGVILHDWGVHAPSDGGALLDFKTYPPELATEIEKKYGLDPLEGQMCDRHNPKTLEQQTWFRDALIDRATKKGEIALDQLKKGGWDYFEVAFGDVHCGGHHCWHLHDVTDPEHDPEVLKGLGSNPLLDIYIATDKAVGKIIEAAGPEAMVFVYCSHGMGAEHSGTRMLDRMLVGLEGEKPRNYRNPVLDVARSAWRAMPKGLRRGLKPMQRKAWNAMMNDGFQPNRQKRKYFEVYLNNRSAGVRINVKGRETHGVVEPGAEYEAVVDELMRDLVSFTNVETGEPVVEECVPLIRDGDGQHVETLPDIAVTWNTRHPIRRVSSPKTGEVVNEKLSVRSGDHRPIGQFYAIGPNFEARNLNQPVEAVDFSPTFALLLGLPVPESDGQPIEVLAGSASSVAAE